MATLQKIRNRGILLIIALGLALLSFIIGDFLNHGSTFLGKSRENVAEINGDKVHFREYQELLDQITTFQKLESGQQNIDEQTMQQMRGFVWQQLLRSKLIQSEAEKIGLTVTKDELSDQLIGDNIHPLIQQRYFFMDESGRFNPAILNQFLTVIHDENNYQMGEYMNEYKKYWMFLESSVKNSILEEKYSKLLSSSVAINPTEVQSVVNKNLQSYNVQYLMNPYYSIPDVDFSVSNKEIRKAYNEQLYSFRQEPNMSIKYVSFRLDPKDVDFEETERFINNLKEEFETTDDVVELVNMNSDIQYTGRNYSELTVPPYYKDFAFSGKKGDTFGPIFENNAYSMARITETGIMQADSVRLRHIFLLKDDESKLDSIVGAIRSGANFGELARKYSAVQQTAENDGEIGWIRDGEEGMDKDILHDAFNKRINNVFTQESAQGTQIIQIMERTAPKRKVKLAILERSVIASSKTQSEIYNEAKRFAAELKAEDFDSIANQNQYFVRQANEIYQSNDNVSNIPQSRQIIRWAFDNSKGDISDVFECDQELIVALITDINKTNYKSIDQASSQIRGEIIKDKKAEIMMTDINEKLEEGKSLEEIASEMDLDVKTAENIQFGSYQFEGEGFEPSIIGTVTAMQEGELSQAIKGNSGVYLLQIESVTKNETEVDLDFKKNQLKEQYIYYLPHSVVNDMQNNANIKDNRLNFY